MAVSQTIARPGPTVSLLVSKPFVRVLDMAGPQALEQRQQTLLTLLPRYGLSAEALAVDGARMPHDMTLDLLSRSASTLGTDAVVLHALQAWQMGDHGLGDYLNATAATVGDLLATTTQFIGLLHDGQRLSLRADGEDTVLVFEYDEDVTVHPWFSEGVLGKIVAELRRALGPGATAGPSAAHFAHHAPGYERAYRDVLGCPVHFGQGQDALVFPSRVLETPLATADPVLHELLRRQAISLLRTARKRVSFVDQVRAVAEEELGRNTADQGSVARRLGVSAATLRRRLEECGARYSELLEELRKDVASRHLSECVLPIEEISVRAGFSQRTAFYRAFHRWFGCTPAEFRRARSAR